MMLQQKLSSFEQESAKLIEEVEELERKVLLLMLTPVPMDSSFQVFALLPCC